MTSALGKWIQLDRPQPRADREPPTRNGMLGRVGLALPLEGGRATQSFRLYAGPNETSALRELEIGGSVNFGFFGSMFRPAEPPRPSKTIKDFMSQKRVEP